MAAQCTNCGKQATHLHCAAQFPTVTLCYPCVREWFESLYYLGVADGNPLIGAFWYDQLRLTIRSDDRDNSWTYVQVKGFKIQPNKQLDLSSEPCYHNKEITVDNQP